MFFQHLSAVCYHTVPTTSYLKNTFFKFLCPIYISVWTGSATMLQASTLLPHLSNKYSLFFLMEAGGGWPVAESWIRVKLASTQGHFEPPPPLDPQSLWSHRKDEARDVLPNWRKEKREKNLNGCRLPPNQRTLLKSSVPLIVKHLTSTARRLLLTYTTGHRWCVQRRPYIYAIDIIYISNSLWYIL